MPVSLDPKAFINNSVAGNLKTINDIKQSRVTRVRSDLDRVYTETETKARSSFLKLPYIDLYGFPIDTNHLIFLKKDETMELQCGVFSIRNKELYMATPDPGHVGQKEWIAKLVAGGYQIKLHLCSSLSFQKMLNTYNNIIEVRKINDGIELDSSLLKEKKDENFDLKQLGKQLESVSMSQFIETVLIVALNGRASDIHFEPEKETYNIRLRIDGVLYTIAELPIAMVKNIESRLKLVAGLKLNVDNTPQDGRFSFQARDKEIDVRVSMLPSNYGYSVVMRLLGTGDVALNLESLGFTGLAKKRVMTSINKPQGMILTTGPTGSGKTTTLYTFLSDLNDGQSKIITLEDPIEYKLAGVSQTQIDTKAGYTFGSGLRSILRQDPDIVMVGEIRDSETAEVAVQASLTGHQVLSTVHTNDATGAIPRLIEMGIQGFILADSLSAIIGQRLVRRLCQYCKIPVALTEDQKEIVTRELLKIPAKSEIVIPEHIHFQTATGCAKCNGLGYKGRVGVYEVLSVTDGLRELLSKEHISTMDVRKVANEEGMITMLQDGIIKAIDGLTSIEELLENVG
jgi:type II secretory ATPase GspE/PulE/Tfp pilus assembly ATPase PilB-like protein